jgi:hypothetical protein
MKRAAKIDRDLPSLRDVYNHSRRSFTPDEAAAFKMWKSLYDKYESMKENFNHEDVDAALIYFDLNTKAGPKIGITRRDRLARHRLLNIDVPQDVVDMIEGVDWIGDYVYGERPPYYMSRLIEAARITA